MRSRSKSVRRRKSKSRNSKRSRSLVRIKISPKHKGQLQKFGYSSNDPVEVRHKALRKAVKYYGRGNVVKKLNAICIFNKRNPALRNKFCGDKKYVQSLE
jgi:hypothetical protein